MYLISYSTELEKAANAFAKSNNDAITDWAGQRKIRWTACSGQEWSSLTKEGSLGFVRGSTSRRYPWILE